jgi:hypothetical protein
MPVRLGLRRFGLHPKFFCGNDRLSPVAQFRFAALTRAIGATEDPAVLRLHSVPNDPAAAMLAGGSQDLNRTLEYVECVGLALSPHFKRLIVVVTAQFTFRHTDVSPGERWSRV